MSQLDSQEVALVATQSTTANLRDGQEVVLLASRPISDSNLRLSQDVILLVTSNIRRNNSVFFVIT